MPRLVFYPLGNADCCRIELKNKDDLLFDYAATRCADDKTDKRCDLPAELRKDLKAKSRTALRVVAFTHLDDDHIKGTSEFFYLEHAKKYQEGERIKIEELWVPAAVILEEGLTDEARIIRSEAQHRLKEGKGIRVFSRPEKLKKWLEDQGISYESRKHLITDAGSLVPGFDLNKDGLEVFVYSPFAKRLDDGELLDRNADSLVVQLTFSVKDKVTRVMMGSDVDYSALSDIVDITRRKNREERLAWDVFKLPHHCSYAAIGPKRGTEKTNPVEQTKWLYETQGQPKAIMVSTSCPIPAKGSKEDDCPQPPHRQAAEYHREHTQGREGKFKVTMEHPSEEAPDRLVIEIDHTKARFTEAAAGGAAAIVSRPSPRAG